MLFPQYHAIFFFLLVMYSAVASATLPVWFSFGAELTYPMQPALVTSSMVMTGNTVAAILISVISFILEVEEDEN